MKLEGVGMVMGSSLHVPRLASRSWAGLLLFAAVATLGGCTTGARIMGLSLAEDVTRISGALSNQEASATKLADQLASARAVLEAQEKKLKRVDAWRREDEGNFLPDGADAGVAGLASLASVWLLNQLRNKSRARDILPKLPGSSPT